MLCFEAWKYIFRGNIFIVHILMFTQYKRNDTFIPLFHMENLIQLSTENRNKNVFLHRWSYFDLFAIKKLLESSLRL